MSKELNGIVAGWYKGGKSVHACKELLEGGFITCCEKKEAIVYPVKSKSEITCKSCLRLKSVKEQMVEVKTEEDFAVTVDNAQVKPVEEIVTTVADTLQPDVEPKKKVVRDPKLDEVFDPKEIFKRGVMVTLYVRMWGATSRVDNADVMDADVPTEVVRAVQDLITKEDKARLEQLRSIKNEAFGIIRRYSLPSPIREFYFVGKQFISTVNENLLDLQVRYMDIAKEVASNIKKMEENFSKAYPQMYKKDKYPTESRLLSIFQFKFNFRVLGVPDQLSDLSPELYKEETNKLKQEFRSMGEDIKNMVATEFFKRIETLKGQCENNKVNMLTLQSLNDFLGKFEEIYDGFVFHSKLKEAIKDIREYVEDSDSEMFKYSDDYRMLVGEKLADVSKEIKAAKDIELKRDILI